MAERLNKIYEWLAVSSERLNGTSNSQTASVYA